MKKNLMSVLILALVMVNLILTGILTITILPQTKKSNELVNKVCSAIDLELESGDGTESASIPMDQVETYKIEDAMTINLKDTINSVINTFTMDEFNADRQAVKDAILAELQKQFGSDFIIAVNFSEVTVV